MRTNTITPYPNSVKSKKEQVAGMFDQIAQTYDFLNHFLSLGIDKSWRKKAISKLKDLKPAYILDVATGTGDMAIEALSLQPEKIIGVDISEGMLEIARKKIHKRKLDHKIEVHKGDSEKLLFDDNTFDAVTVSFGVRNFENLSKGLADIFRVLKPGGKLVVLEFSNPRQFPVKQLYRFYFFRILPLLGRIFSGDSKAYTYLPESVAAFPDGEKFLDYMQEQGFSDTSQQALMLGICSIYTGKK